MERKIVIAIALMICAAGVLFASGSFAAAKNAASGRLTDVFRKSPSFAGFFSGTKAGEDIVALMRENERLKAELLESRREPKTSETGATITVKIYSTYPFNNRGLITVNAGVEDGVKQGFAVTVDGVIFLGQVTEVYPHMSVIRTIFDSDWQVPVKAGNDHIDGLLVGGRTPIVTLVARDASLEPGAEVYTASRDFPYGLKIGEVAHVEDSPGTNFKAADMRLAFDPGTLTEVQILTR